MTLPNADTLRCFLIRFITHPIELGHWLVNVDKMIAFTETFATTKVGTSAPCPWLLHNQINITGDHFCNKNYVA
jgi:hypothetical protein